jgi:hypothetical protein
MNEIVLQEHKPSFDLDEKQFGFGAVSPKVVSPRSDAVSSPRSGKIIMILTRSTVGRMLCRHRDRVK